MKVPAKGLFLFYTITVIMESKPIVVETTVNAPASRIWHAITDKEAMKSWYFDMPAFSPEVGNKFEFTGENDGRKYYHLCTVKEVIPNKKLSHSWRYDGYEGDSLVTWELNEAGDQTRVKLTHEGLETFPPIPDFARNNFVEGWTYILNKSLKEFVEKKPA